MCTCLLAPENPKNWKGKSVWCDEDCRVEVTHRIFVNCRERQVMESLLDFKFIKIDKETALGQSDHKIKVFEQFYDSFVTPIIG